jgi:prevent-host-death family protein
LIARRALSVAEVKATLSDAIRDVEAGASIVITRHGKPVAALVRAEDLTTIERLRSAGPEKGLASLAGGWEGAKDLIKAIESAPRRAKRRVTNLE